MMAVVYFLFMSGWLNVVLFFGMLAWVRVGGALLILRPEWLVFA